MTSTRLTRISLLPPADTLPARRRHAGCRALQLVQNAVEHGYPGTASDAEGEVVVRLSRDDRELRVEVRDDGVGFPAGFSLASSKSLGLSIVRTLITTELGGAIALRNEGGAVAELRVPRG